MHFRRRVRITLLKSKLTDIPMARSVNICTTSILTLPTDAQTIISNPRSFAPWRS